MLNKKFLFIIVSTIFLGELSFAQNKIIYLSGKGRHYGDSVVLRWNTEDLFSFVQFAKSTLIIERKTSSEKNYRPLTKQTMKPVQSWGINQYTKNNLLLLSAASMQHLNNVPLTQKVNVPEQMQLDVDMKFYWTTISLAADLDREIANLCNLRFVDHNTRNLDSVQYKVYLDCPGYTSDTLFIVLEGGKETYRTKQVTIRTFENESEVKLEWNADKQYSAYYVQQFVESKSTFITLNKSPLVIPVFENTSPLLFWKDSLQNYVPRIYRIIAIDLFGDTALISHQVKAMARDRTAPPMASGLQVKEVNGSLELSWNKIGKEFGESGIALGLKHHLDDAFEPLHNELLSTDIQKYKIKIDSNITDYYFLVQVFDTAGNSSQSGKFYQLEDHTPPSKPMNLKANIDTNGVVTLKWNWNNENDLKGYLVYYSNAMTNEFSGIVNSPLNDTIFLDTLSLRMLNREVYYIVVAADNRFNLSASSDTVKVLRPDTLKPVTPVIRDYAINDSTIQIVWIPSSSSDVVMHQLIRKNIKTGHVKSIDIDVKDTVYTDRQILAGEQYAYSLQAIDESGNISLASSEIILKTFKNMFRAPVKIFVVFYDSMNNTVNLKWEMRDTNIKKILIYKGIDKESVTPVPATLIGTETAFIDRKVIRNNVYFYAIRIYFMDGTETLLNQAVGVLTQ